MVDTRKAEGKGRNLMVSRDRMVLHLEQAAVAELGVGCHVSRRDHHGGRYARWQLFRHGYRNVRIADPRSLSDADGHSRRNLLSLDSESGYWHRYAR